MKGKSQHLETQHQSINVALLVQSTLASQMLKANQYLPLRAWSAS